MGGLATPDEQPTALTDLAYASSCLAEALEDRDVTVTDPKVGRDSFMFVAIIDSKAYKLWGQEVK